MKSNRGFTLLEIVIALGIAALVAVLLSSFETFNHRSTHGLAKSVAFDELVSTLLQIVGNPAACNHVFQGLATNPGVELTLTMPTGGSGVVWQHGSTVVTDALGSNIKISSVQFQNRNIYGNGVVEDLHLVGDLQGNGTEQTIGSATREAVVTLAFSIDPSVTPVTSAPILGCGDIPPNPIKPHDVHSGLVSSGTRGAMTVYKAMCPPGEIATGGGGEAAGDHTSHISWAPVLAVPCPPGTRCPAPIGGECDAQDPTKFGDCHTICRYP